MQIHWLCVFDDINVEYKSGYVWTWLHQNLALTDKLGCHVFCEFLLPCVHVRTYRTNSWIPPLKEDPLSLYCTHDTEDMFLHCYKWLARKRAYCIFFTLVCNNKQFSGTNMQCVCASQSFILTLSRRPGICTRMHTSFFFALIERVPRQQCCWKVRPSFLIALLLRLILAYVLLLYFFSGHTPPLHLFPFISHVGSAK